MERSDHELIDWVRRTSDGRRYIYFGTDILQEFRRDLSTILSAKVSKEILYRAGLATGRIAWQRMKESVKSEEGFWHVADETDKLRGWGKILSHETSSHNGSLTITMKYEDSAFADAVTTAEPVCDIVRGAFAATLAGFYGKKTLRADETQCRATGAKHCVFMIQLGSLPVTTTPVQAKTEGPL